MERTCKRAHEHKCKTKRVTVTVADFGYRVIFVFLYLQLFCKFEIISKQNIESIKKYLPFIFRLSFLIKSLAICLEPVWNEHFYNIFLCVGVVAL